MVAEDYLEKWNASALQTELQRAGLPEDKEQRQDASRRPWAALESGTPGAMPLGVTITYN